MDLKEFFTGYKGKNIPKELNEFNWGAFLLTFIWGWKYKAWVTFLAIPLILIQMPLCLNWILLVLLQFYCGFKGNEWAYQVEYWKKPADFRKSQTLWAVSAITISVVVPFIVLVILLRFINKSEDNLLVYTKNMQCYTANKTLKKYLPKTLFTAMSTDEETAGKFAAVLSASKSSNTVTVDLTGGLKMDYTFVKSDESPCSLSYKNCHVQASYNFGIPDKLFPGCTYYYDQNKNIVPDAQTSDSLEKGINIFNYL